MADRIGVAIVGCAHIHVPGFIATLNARQADVEVRWVWDHDPQRGRRRADEIGAKFVPEIPWDDPTVRAAVVATETNRHEALVLAGAKARKHLFVEKPLGMNQEDAGRIAQAIQNAGVLFQTGYFMRGDPKIIFLSEQLRLGNLGQITRVRGSNCHAGALKGWFDTEWRWMADVAQAGVGAFGDLGTHSLDILIQIAGEIEQVTAALSTGSARYGCDEFGEAAILFKNGIIGTLAAGWDDLSNPVSLEICGTQGHATIVNGELFFQSSKVEGADGKKAWTALPPPWPKPLELFLDAVTGKKNVPLVSATDAAYRCKVMEAIYRAAAQRAWVKL